MKADYFCVYVGSVGHTHFTMNTNINHSFVLCVSNTICGQLEQYFLPLFEFTDVFKKFAFMFVWEENSINVIISWAGFFKPCKEHYA